MKMEFATVLVLLALSVQVALADDGGPECAGEGNDCTDRACCATLACVEGECVDLRPDIAASIGAAQIRVAGGAEGAIRVVTRNIGQSEAEGFAISATSQLGVRPADGVSVMMLDAGDSRNDVFYAACPRVGAEQQYQVRIEADSGRSIAEPNEVNNVATINVICTPVASSDLVVGSVLAQPQVNYSGKQIRVNVVVENVGDALQAQVGVRASVTGAPGIAAQNGQVEILMDAPSASGYFVFTCPAVNEYTTYIVGVAVDPDAQIAETNENNNVHTGIFSCAPEQASRTCRAPREGEDQLACESCSLACRVQLRYADPQQARFLYEGETVLCEGNLCMEGECAYPCMKQLALPNSESCQPYNANAQDATSCKKCRYECRVLENGEVPDSCNTNEMQGACLPQSCANSCKVEIASANRVQVCMPYLGNGEGVDPAQTEISARQAPYNDRSACRQCPEECRISGDPNACNLDGVHYDCSLRSCPSECRVQLPAVEAGGACREFVSGFCTGCPLECRLIGTAAPNWQERCAPFCSNCIEECKAKVPQALCASEQIASCSQDCLGIPQIRTDCAQQCTQDELTGISGVTPASFITRMGGAQGDSQTKAVGLLMLPALVLPLFNIVLIISFVRTLSPILGGDVEIPGIARLI